MMDIKEWSIGGVVVLGGAALGISQLGLNDVLSEEIRHISDVPRQERPAYMEEVASEFAEAFATYEIQSETYLYVGNSNFSTSPVNGTFVELVKQNSPVPKEEVKGLTARMNSQSFCDQAEMTMFTDNGWTYRFTVEDSKGQRIFATVCRPALTPPKLRGMS